MYLIDECLWYDKLCTEESLTVEELYKQFSAVSTLTIMGNSESMEPIKATVHRLGLSYYGDDNLAFVLAPKDNQQLLEALQTALLKTYPDVKVNVAVESLKPSRKLSLVQTGTGCFSGKVMANISRKKLFAGELEFYTYLEK